MFKISKRLFWVIPTPRLPLLRKRCSGGGGNRLDFIECQNDSGVLTFDDRAETNGNFIITGGSGNDDIVGSSVNNTLNGGGGDDTFTFVAGTGLTTDTINGGTRPIRWC